MGGTDRISQPPGKIAGRRKTRDCGISQRKSTFYFSDIQSVLLKILLAFAAETACAASFTRRVAAKKSLKSNHAFPQHFINAEVCICNDVRLHCQPRLSPHAAKITFNQTESFWIKLIHSESIESYWICWIILNPLNHTESAESYWICWIRPNLLNHIESVRITLKQSESYCKLFVLKTES